MSRPSSPITASAAEARLLGLSHLLRRFPRERSAVADALTYCDLTTGPTGKRLAPRERVADVQGRYGTDHVVSRALGVDMPYLEEAVRRTEDLLACRARSGDDRLVQALESVPQP